MSYYYKHNYNFTYHGLQRCKERLGLKHLDDFQAKDEIMKLIKNSTESFESSREIYIALKNNPKIYLVVNKTTNLVITCTKISIEKQWRLSNS